MKARTATAGATLIIVVLFTLLLLVLVLAATMRLGLTSRQNTSDQKAILHTQYGAESKLNRIKSQLRDYQTLMSATRPNPAGGSPIVQMQVTAGATKEQLNDLALNYCNKQGVSNAWVATTDYADARSELDGEVYAGAERCIVDAGVNNPNQFSVLAQYVTPAAYDILPAIERPGNVNDVNSRLVWWSSLLRNQQVASDNSTKFNLRATKVDRLSLTRFRFFVAVNDAAAQAVDGGARRVLKANRASSGEWWFEIELPSLLTDVLMTNHHRGKVSQSSYSPTAAPGINFVTQEFDGSVFTNEKFLFHSVSGAKFRDTVRSAGCTGLPYNGQPSDNCTPVAGAYIGSTLKTGTNDEIADEIVKSPRTVDFVKDNNGDIDYSKINFSANYRPLPDNANDQANAATSGGFNFGSESIKVELKAGNAAGTPLSRYTSPKWAEPSGDTYQYIKITRANSSVEEYRYGPDKKLYKKSATTPNWPGTKVKDNFNGVIYAQSMTSVSGPARVATDSTGALDKAPPALASFAGITLASIGNVGIDSDLTMSETPCTFAESKATPPCLRRPENVLGIYSQNGDIAISSSAKNNVNLHATLLAATGEVTVTDYDSGTSRGNVNLIGSLIENWYGAFGTVNSRTGAPSTGYGRNFTYDSRLKQGITPPFFPVSPRWNVTPASDLSNNRMTDLVWKQASKDDF